MSLPTCRAGPGSGLGAIGLGGPENQSESQSTVRPDTSGSSSHPPGRKYTQFSSFIWPFTGICLAFKSTEIKQQLYTQTSCGFTVVIAHTVHDKNSAKSQCPHDSSFSPRLLKSADCMLCSLLLLGIKGFRVVCPSHGDTDTRTSSSLALQFYIGVYVSGVCVWSVTGPRTSARSTDHTECAKEKRTIFRVEFKCCFG